MSRMGRSEDGGQSSDEIRELIAPLTDHDITRHGFTPYMRDYEIFADEWQPDGPSVPFRWRFSHCVRADLRTALRPEVWVDSWTDQSIDPARARAAEASGFLWSVGWAAAYPGFEYVADSPEASSWSEKLRRPMHEVVLTTNVFVLRLIFHRLKIGPAPRDE